MDYKPKPIDVDDICLPDELSGLIEQLAKNVHEVWAKGRIDEGWTYGATHDYKLKKHPCLVPYEELPESERDFDRNTAVGTLKFILKSGFKIEK